MKKFLCPCSFFVCFLILTPSYSFAQTSCSEELNFRVNSYGSGLHGKLFWNHLRLKYKNYQILAFDIPLTTIDAASFYFSNAKNLRTSDPSQQFNYDRAINNISSVQEIEFSIKPISHFGRQLEAVGLQSQCDQPIASPILAVSSFTRSAINSNRDQLCDDELNFSVRSYGGKLHGELSWNHRRLRYRKYKVLAWGIEIATVDASSFYIANARDLRTLNTARQREFDLSISNVSSFEQVDFSLRPENYQGQYLDPIYPNSNCSVLDISADSNTREQASPSLGMPTPPLDGQWELSWSDEFDWLNLNNWNTQYIWDRSTIINNERQWYVDDNSEFHDPFQTRNGILSITAAPTPSDQKWRFNGQDYLSGVLTSRVKGHSQLYGYFEARMRLPRARGAWPAFWMLPTHDQWPAGISVLSEIDIMEAVGEVKDGIYHGSAHTNQNGYLQSDGSAIHTGTNLTDNFNTYGLYWGPNETIWYFNGREVKRISTPADWHHPRHFLLNLAVGGNWPPPPVQSDYPASFEIDYLRAWSKR